MSMKPLQSENEFVEMWVAPNGIDHIDIHPDGFIEFSEDMSDTTKELIQDMTQQAMEILEERNEEMTPQSVFTLIGWKKVEIQ